MSDNERRIFLVSLGARPTEGLEQFDDLGGAIVNCWVHAASERDAVAIAQAEVRDAAWDPEPIRSVGLVTVADYADDAAGREHFEQAMLDGIVVVFHTWPTGASEDDTLH